ncbi:MAG: hypothetical protein ACK595_03710, partial [Planctomycetota bacterium]
MRAAALLPIRNSAPAGPHGVVGAPQRRAGHRLFDRVIRIARAEKALREQRFEDALQQAIDPVVAT